MSETKVPSFPFSIEPLDARGMLLRYVRGRRWVYLAGAFAVIVTNLTEVMVPKCIQWSLDLLSGNPVPAFVSRFAPTEVIQWCAIALAVVLLVQAASRRSWRLSLARETHRAAAALKSTLWNRVRYLPREQLEHKHTVGALMNAGTSDVASARLNFGWAQIGLIDFLFLTCFTLAAMATIHLPLTLATLALLCILPLAMARFAKREYDQHEVAQSSLSELNELCTQAVSTVKLQRLTRTGARWTEKLVEASDEYRGKRLAVIRTSLAFVIVTGFVPLLCYIVLFWWGLREVSTGALSIGELVAMQSYIFILQSPLAELGFVVSEWQRGMASLSRLSEVYREPLMPGVTTIDSPAPSDAPGVSSIAAVGLTFAYPGSSRLAFDRLTFDLEPGERLGITGPIGAGKSTLLRVIAGLEHRFEGELRIFGNEVRRYDHHTLRSMIALVPQKPFLFADTIRANLALDLPLDDGSLWHLLELAGIATEVRALPSQLDTPLGEWGINLSGGQKQRLTLARALARRPRILLLDDCLSAVDTLTEERILEGLNEELTTTTLVWTAHRRSTLRMCTAFLELAA